MPDESTTTHADTAQGPVPYTRFAEVAQERAALKAQVATLTESAAKFEAAAKDAAEARAELDRLRSDYAERTALTKSGITDEDGQDVARLLYGRLPAEGKPKSIGEWVGALRAEGATVPKPLAPYLSATSAPPATTTTPAPKASAPSATAPPAAGAVTSQAIIDAYSRLRASPNDPAARAAVDAIRASALTAR